MTFHSKMKFSFLKMSFLFIKENIRKYTGNFQKILKRVFLITHAFLSKMLLNRPPIWGGLISNIYHENASVIRKTPFNYTYRSQKTKDFVKLKMRFSNYRSIFMVNYLSFFSRIVISTHYVVLHMFTLVNVPYFNDSANRFSHYYI